MSYPEGLDQEISHTIALLYVAMAGAWSTEQRGDDVAVYSGRDDTHHGSRLMNLVDGDRNFQNNIDAIVSAVNGYHRLADALTSERANSKEWCDLCGRAQIKSSELVEKLNDFDLELAATLSLLWERSAEEEKEDIKLKYPNWSTGDQNVHIQWSPMSFDNSDETEDDELP